MQKLSRVVLLLLIGFLGLNVCAQSEPFSERTLVAGLNSPWEILYGPNDSIWVTENVTYLVKRVNVANGSATTLLNLAASKNFSQGDGGRWPQGGLMGMVLHPNLYASDLAVRNAKPWVYLAYVFNRPTGQTCSTNAGSSNPCNFWTRIVRYVYSGNSLTLPEIVLDSIPGSNDHNSGRLTIGPDLKLYYTIGDLGAGQFNNATRPNNAQTLDAFDGKVIRLNTETDGDNGMDAWVPNDNPNYNGSPITPRDYVYSLGHRNAQGIAWGTVNGISRLYSSEHGDRSDDEINLILANGNYGWNRVSGNCDGNYNGMTLGGFSPVNENTFCGATPTNQVPIKTLFTVPASTISSLSGDYLSWPTVAPSSIEFYGFSRIPNWENSLLIPCLKAGRVYRLKLNATGTSVVNHINGTDTASYFRGKGRFRDMAVSPDGLKFYLACDASGQTSGPTGSFNGGGTPPPNAGSIIEFTYTGSVLPLTDLVRDQRVIPPSEIRVFPNPVSFSLSIYFTRKPQRPYTVQVYNSVGVMMQSLRGQSSNMVIRVPQWKPGTYFVEVRNDIGQILKTEKIQKL